MHDQPLIAFSAPQHGPAAIHAALAAVLVDDIAVPGGDAPGEIAMAVDLGVRINARIERLELCQDIAYSAFVVCPAVVLQRRDVEEHMGGILVIKLAGCLGIERAPCFPDA